MVDGPAAGLGASLSPHLQHDAVAVAGAQQEGGELPDALEGNPAGDHLRRWGAACWPHRGDRTDAGDAGRTSGGRDDRPGGRLRGLAGGAETPSDGGRRAGGGGATGDVVASTA